MKANHLTTRIVTGLVLGVVCGALLHLFPADSLVHEWMTNGLLNAVGRIFVASLKMLVVPLVFVSLVCGVHGLDDVKKLGTLGIKTLALYLLTTAMAIALALVCASLVQPGVGFNLPSEVQFQAKAPPPLADIVVGMFPTNPVKAAAEGNMLQIIVFALLFGVGVVLSGSSGQKVAHFFTSLNQVIMKIVTVLMRVAPFGVFALVAKVFAEQGFAAIRPLASYFFLVLAVLILHSLITYPLLLVSFARYSPITFFERMRPVILFAFSTASSNATIPVTMDVVTNRLGVKRSTAAFTIPLGATINMDGTAIMQGVATLFIAQAYNISLTFPDMLTVVLTATLASIGTAGVPGVGLITLAMVLRQVGLPVEGIGLIIGIDRLLDMVRTAVNVCGDATVSCVVSRQ